MIGQRELLKKIDGQIERDKFPKITVLIGEKGSGRKTLARHIAEKMNHKSILVEPDVNDVLEAYHFIERGSTGVFIFDNFDFMLDIESGLINMALEDTPYLYIIVTCENFNNLPQEIKTNSVSYTLEPYYDDEKFDFLYECGLNGLESEDEEFIVDTATCLGDVKDLRALNIKNFKSYVESLLDNFLSDCFISHENSSKIAFNDECGKFPVRLIWKAFTTICGNRMRTDGNSLMYCRFIAITEEVLQDSIGSSESSLDAFKSWESKIREEYEKFRD